MIQINNLSIKFDNEYVIKNLNFSASKGYTALLGASGAGKTSVINAILGLIEYEGTISNSDAFTSVVFQENRLVNSMTLAQNLRMITKNKAQINEGLFALGLSESANKKISTLSGGMQRRVAILRALLVPHSTLILDEPFYGLDETTKAKVMQYIKEKTSESTVLLITHNPSEAEFFNSNIIQL